MYLQTLHDAVEFIEALPRHDRALVKAHLKSLELGQTGNLFIKTLHGKIKELIVQRYRMVFVIMGDAVFVLDAFKKQSKKTPKRIIERAEKIYQHIIHNQPKNIST